MADIASHRRERHFRNLTKLGIVGVGSIGFELIAAPRLTAHDQVTAIFAHHSCPRRGAVRLGADHVQMANLKV
jgi:hypothetical protein